MLLGGKSKRNIGKSRKNNKKKKKKEGEKKKKGGSPFPSFSLFIFLFFFSNFMKMHVYCRVPQNGAELIWRSNDIVPYKTVQLHLLSRSQAKKEKG